MKRLSVGLAVFLLLTGCGCQMVEVNDTAVVTGIAIDWKNHEFLVTAQIAEPQTQEQAGSQEGPPFVIVSESGQSISEAARRIMLTLPKLPLWFNASTLVLGEELAWHGLTPMTDFLARNRNLRKNTLIVLSRGVPDSSDILKVHTPLEPHSGTAIRRILEIQERQTGLYVPVTLAEFLRKLSTPGVDPTMPQVRIKEERGKRLLTIDGTAVFRGPLLVGELNEPESRGFRFLSPDRIRGGLVVIPSPGDSSRKVTIELITSLAVAKPVWDEEGNLRMQIKVQAEGNFYEQTSREQLLTLPVFAQLEQLTAQEMKQEMEQALHKAQSLQADIFGWGRLVESHHPQAWKELQADWPQVFSQLDADISVDFKLRRTYLTDRSFIFR